MKNIRFLLPAILLVTFFSSCLRPRLIVRPKFISGFTWELVWVNGKKVRPELYDGIYPTLEFVDDNTMGGYSGCNGFSSEFALNDTEIQVNNILTTYRGCGDLPGKIEDEYYSALKQSTQLFSEGEDLIFMKDGQISMKLRKRK